MAGRGTRVGGYGEKKIPVRKPGELAAAPAIAHSPSVITLIEKINSINVTKVDVALLEETEQLLVKLCSNADQLKGIVLDLHTQALIDSDFGDKMAIALCRFIKISFQVDGTQLKKAIINHLQDDFEAKYSDYQSDRQKYMNAANLLGNFYGYMRAGSQPIYVMGKALLEYISNLLKGSEEELKIVAAQVNTLKGSFFLQELRYKHYFHVLQVLINNQNLIANANNLGDKYDLVQKALRKRLIGNDLSSKSRCWILLCLDHMSNPKFMPENLRKFYEENVGQDFVEIEKKAKTMDKLKCNVRQFTKPISAVASGGQGDFANNHVTSLNALDSIKKKHVENRDVFQVFDTIHIKDKPLNDKGFEADGRQWRERKERNWRNMVDDGRNMKALDDKRVTSPKESLSVFKNDDFYSVQLSLEKNDTSSKSTGKPGRGW